ncbi:MAG: glycosyltransferase [Planctomycetota bacterium]
MSEAPCDIIVPVYGAYDHVVRCIARLREHTQVPYRLLLVDDANTDPRLLAWFAAQGREPGTLVLQNDVNQGFVASCNRALRESRGHVVLLNSDVDVTERWLEKLLRVLQQHARVATVSPLTNNADLCSVPVFFGANRLPDGFSLEQFAQLVEDAFAGDYPELPTTVGFCMLIRREALAEIGPFDEATFGRGYGEENDFCLRAAARGWTHRLDPATYVYHHGGASFGWETSEQSRRNYKKLCQRHPHYDRTIQAFRRLNPLKPIHERIRDRLRAHYRELRRPRVLFLVHQPVFGEIIGGTTLLVRDLMNHVTGIDFFTLHTEREALVLNEVVAGVPARKEYFLPTLGSDDRAPIYASELCRILKEFRFDLIHVQHLMDHEPAGMRVIAESEIPLVVSINDYHVLCPEPLLMNHVGSYCGVPSDLKVCDTCLGVRREFLGIDIRTHRSQMRRFLAHAQRIFFPSVSARDLVLAQYPELSEAALVIEHGTALPARAAELPRRATAADEPRTLRVAMMGSLAAHKGRYVVKNLITYNRNPYVEWHLLGGQVEDLVLPREIFGKVVAHGLYQRERVLALLRENHIDVTLMPSVCSETFSFTLSESWLAGIPAIVSHFGALAERVRATGAGWVVDPYHYRDLLDLVSSLQGDRSLIEARAELARRIKIRSAEECAAEYAAHYRDVLLAHHGGAVATPGEKSVA